MTDNQMQPGRETERQLEFHNISKQYPGVKALDDVSFTIRAGKVTP